MCYEAGLINMLKWSLRPGLLICALLLLVACHSGEIGNKCERTGDGFLSRDSCENNCLAWAVSCGDGTRISAPNICSGMQDCSLHKPCPDQQVCAISGGNNYCVPLSLCPSGVPTNQPSSTEILKSR